MGQNRVIVIIIVLIVFGLSCRNNRDSESKRTINLIEEQKKTFEGSYTKSQLFEHFPKRKEMTQIWFLSMPPSCPPKYRCTSQSGEVYLICERDSSLNLIEPEDYLHKTLYSNDSNIIIDCSELEKDSSLFEKSNTFFQGKYPIPIFEKYEFELGTDTLEIYKQGKTSVRTFNIIPSDLEVFVIEAKAGNFWKVDCAEGRLESLGMWKNGYSKGIASSKKEKLIVYWTIVW